MFDSSGQGQLRALSFGEELRRRRLDAELTQEQLAERAGLSVRGLSDLERDIRHAPYRDTVERLAAALCLDETDRLALFQLRQRNVTRAAQVRVGPKHTELESGSSRKLTLACRHNLPSELSSFVGRATEVAAVREHLAAARLVTLTGPGGVGKTRLALRVASDVVDGFPEGAWFVDLAPLADGELVPRAVASALGVREEPTLAITDLMAAVLSTQRVLLLLDNCEHVVRACATLADRLLRACPAIRVLATSREALRIDGETVWRVPPLKVPEAPLGAPDQLQEVESVQLFVERAAAAQRGFSLRDQHAPAVAEICQRLDGIPLAIELAAARVGVLSPAQIAERLDQRFQLLTTGNRTAPLRHQTLWGTTAWSYDLLVPGDQRLFRRLAVFAGGCTLAAAECLCEMDEDVGQTVLDGLASLVDKNLLRREDQAEGEPRFGMLETIREFALERLVACGDEARSRRRHAACLLALAELAAPRLRGHQQAEWLARLELEHDNLRTALGWTVENGETELALRLGASLARFWDWHGHIREGRKRLREVLRLAETSTATGRALVALAAVLSGAGKLAWVQTDYGEARSLLDQSLVIRRELGDRLGMAASLRGLADVARLQGNYTEARALLEESLTIGAELTDGLCIAMSLRRLGAVAWSEGNYATARRQYEQSLAIQQELGDRLGMGGSLGSLGDVAQKQGDYATAQSFYEQSLTLWMELGNWTWVARALEGLAGVAAAAGRARRSLQLAGAAAALRGSIGAPRPRAEEDQFRDWLQPAQRALSEQETAAAWAEGHGMSGENAAAYALNTRSSPTLRFRVRRRPDTERVPHDV